MLDMNFFIYPTKKEGDLIDLLLADIQTNKP